MVPGFFEALSAIEWVIFSFIAANIVIVSVCLILNGLNRLPPAGGGLLPQTKRDASNP